MATVTPQNPAVKALSQTSRWLARPVLFLFLLALGQGLRAETPATPAKSGDSVKDFALIDHRGAFRHLYYYAKDPATKAIVLFVQGNGCPLVRKRLPELKRLREAYATNGVLF